MLVWQQNIQKKFEDKFPEYYRGCKDGKWYFLRSSNMCAVTNSELKVVCTFTYRDDQHFSLEISTVKGGVK